MIDQGGRVGSSQPVPTIDSAFFRDLDVGDLARKYREADPYPHIAVSGLFPDEVLHKIREEIGRIEVDPEKDFYSTYLKHRISDMTRLPPTARRLIEDLNGAGFLGYLERLTGIDGLIPDPYLEGGGIHQIGTGGYLKIHTDFNYHSHLRLHRRINLLLYLNPDWRPEWGGALELWDAEVTECKARYLPDFNRMVVFSTTDRSYHGHPDPLTCPENVRRNSIALYYYTVDRPQDEVRFTKSTMTNYQPRPSEKFSRGRLHHLINQIEIRFPLVRRLLSLARRLR